MGVKAIPAKFIHSCDGCGKQHESPSERRPDYWIDLIFSQDSYDFQGHAVADGTIKRRLCQSCAEKAQQAISGAFG